VEEEGLRPIAGTPQYSNNNYTRDVSPISSTNSSSSDIKDDDNFKQGMPRPGLSPAYAKVLRQYHTLVTLEAGIAARDAALWPHAKVLRGYHNKHKSSIGVFHLKGGNLFVVKLLFVMSFVGMINVSLFQSYVTFIALQSKDVYPPLYLLLIISGRRTNVCCLQFK